MSGQGASWPANPVPGNPDALQTGIVAALYHYADLLTEAGNGLKQIGTAADWSGPAASAFHAAYDGQPSRWLQAGDAFRQAGQALDQYTEALSWAVDQGNQVEVFYEANDKSSGDQLLASVQSQLAGAASRAAAAVNAAAKLAPPAPGLWSQVGHDLMSVGDAMRHDPLAAVTNVGGSIIAGAGVAMTLAGVVPAGLALVAGGSVLTGIGSSSLQQQDRLDDGLGTVPGAAAPAPATAQGMAEQAAQLGFTASVNPDKALTAGVDVNPGSPVFSDGGSYITPQDGGWWLYDKQGNFLGSYTWDLTYATKNPYTGLAQQSPSS